MGFSLILDFLGELAEEKIPESFGTILPIKDEKISIFCVDDFSILDADGIFCQRRNNHR